MPRLAGEGRQAAAEDRGPSGVRHRARSRPLRWAAPRVRCTTGAPHGPLEPEIQTKIARALALQPSDIVHHQWVDNGPGWCAVMLHSARQVLSLKPDWVALAPLKLGVVGPHESGDAAFEVRAFVGGSGYEDPVTGSLNASLAQWLIGARLAKPSYVAAQGAALQRAGRVHLRQDGDDIWVGGDVVAVVDGEIRL